MRLDWIIESVDFPFSHEPDWASRMERWSQLDQASSVLCETFWQHRAYLTSRPKILFLASPLASNLTDRDFVCGAVPSPAKFVHTLPNSRGAALIRLMEWHGPVFCVQQDPCTLVAAISEATRLPGETWIAGVTGVQGVILRMGGQHGFSLTGKPWPEKSDKDLMAWLGTVER